MSMSQLVSVFRVCFDALLSWLGQFASLYNAYAVLGCVIALFVLGLVIDLFLYIIPRR